MYFDFDIYISIFLQSYAILGSQNMLYNNSQNVANVIYNMTSRLGCNKIDKPLVVYRFLGNVMTAITTLRT